MEAGRVGVSFELRKSACIVRVHGELTVLTSHEFTARVTKALPAFSGPVLFDVSCLEFADCHGARTLAEALRAVSRRETGLYGCSPAVRRLFDMLKLDLPYVATLIREAPAPPPPSPAAPAGPPSRGEDLMALIHANEATARQPATHAGAIMSQLATYTELALNGWYRTPRKSEHRGRLLALSGRARDLSRRYRRHAASDVG
jgi:anti-anti-sigma factor